MAFDELGKQIITIDVEICQRSYDILVNKVGFPQDIIFEYISSCDRNGRTSPKCISSEEQNGFGIYLMHILVVVSNVSFSFRGNDTVREAMHLVFLYATRKR
jgi:5-methyltetrahydrofolate--homocysteine methyltransferase